MLPIVCRPLFTNENQLLFYIMANQNDNSNGNAAKIAAIVLGLLFLGAVGYIFHLNGQLNDYRGKTANLNTTVEELNTEQENLEKELGELNVSYENSQAENVTLQETVEEKVARINSLKSQISRVRKELESSRGDNETVKAELARLESIKAQLESSMANLENANSKLQASETRLTGELTTMKGMVEDLNEQVAELTASNNKKEAHLLKVAPAGYRADEFRIDMERRNDKVTAKARKIREIKVNFNLDNVPADKQGAHKVYVAVTDIFGKPVEGISTTMVNIPAPNESLKVEVAAMQDVNLQDKQKVEFSIQPDAKLSAGEYSLMVYSDSGYLGSTGFRLR